MNCSETAKNLGSWALFKIRMRAGLVPEASGDKERIPRQCWVEGATAMGWPTESGSHPAAEALGWSVPEAVATVLRRPLQCVSSLGCSSPYQYHLLCPISSSPFIPGASEGQVVPRRPELAAAWAAQPLPGLAGA